MRILWALVLCLAIPFQGFANAHAFVTPPCPMEQAAAESALDTVDSLVHDCCNDTGTASATGKLCKTGQDCKLAHACVMLPPGLSTQAPPACCLVSALQGPPSSFDPSSVWRPPTLI